MRLIHVLFTGGTISMRHDASAGGNVPQLGGDALLALAPGIDFDTVNGGHTVRFSFAGAGADIEEALDRLERYLA